MASYCPHFNFFNFPVLEVLDDKCPFINYAQHPGCINFFT